MNSNKFELNVCYSNLGNLKKIVAEKLLWFFMER